MWLLTAIIGSPFAQRDRHVAEVVAQLLEARREYAQGVVCFRTDQEDDHFLPADAGSGECVVAVGYLGVVLDMITPSIRRPLRKPAATRSLSRRRMERNKMAGQMAKRVGRARTSRDWRHAPTRSQVEMATFNLNI